MRVQYFIPTLLLSLCPLSSSASESPVPVVENFYSWAIQPAPQDLERGLGPVSHVLGRELLAALETQRAYEKACARLVPPDIKPYMLDQSPFFLGADGAKTLVSAKATVNGDVARVSAQLAYDHIRWTDTVILRRENSHWVIVNIKWEERSLTQRLVEFASNRCVP